MLDSRIENNIHVFYFLSQYSQIQKECSPSTAMKFSVNVYIHSVVVCIFKELA